MIGFISKSRWPRVHRTGGTGLFEWENREALLPAVLLVTESAAARTQLQGENNQREMEAASLLGSLPRSSAPESTDGCFVCF